ncbi:hypothetical protein GCM10029978_020680 [Actinoallomurus acanthiterrae]
MRRILLALTLGISTVMTLPASTPAHAAGPAYKVLVFSKTAGFRHDSIPAAVQAIRDLGAANDFTVDATEDDTKFTAANLAGYKAVVFALTTGDVLNDTEQAAFEGYIRHGGGFVGIHAAADTEYDWPFYGGLVGAWFKSHPAIQQAKVVAEDRAHPSTAHLASTPWTRTDEWYNYRSNPRNVAHVLASLDESSYDPGADRMGDHPITWCQGFQGGRSWYTGMGHTKESYADPAFRTMILGGIRYAAGAAKADCRPETGYTPLYNGALTGWTQAGPGGFTNTDATLGTQGGMGLLWHSAKQFTNHYSLKVDWKMQGDDNSGVFVGFPDPGGDPWTAVNKGYEIQIDATDSPDHTTGSIYGFQAPDTKARDAALNPPGSWNTYEIVVDAPRIQVYLNGVKINDFVSKDPNRLAGGYVGLQNHSDADHVSFRNVRIKQLTADTTIQAENWSSQSGVAAYHHDEAHGGTVLGFVDPGDWAAYDNVKLDGVGRFSARVASGGPGGGIQVRADSPTGPLLGSVAVPNTGGWVNYTDVSTTLKPISGTHRLYLVFTGSGGGLLDVDDFTLAHTTTTG